MRDLSNFSSHSPNSTSNDSTIRGLLNPSICPVLALFSTLPAIAGIQALVINALDF